jgi:hypothetical protein
MKAKAIYTMLLLLSFAAVNAQGKKIEPSELPEKAIPFLNEHFPNIAIIRASKDWEHGEKGFEVHLADGTEVEFWKDGTWREIDGEGKPIPTAFMPVMVTDYVKTNYPNEKITHIDTGHKNMDVDLTNKIDLDFDKDWKILKSD